MAFLRAAAKLASGHRDRTDRGRRRDCRHGGGGDRRDAARDGVRRTRCAREPGPPAGCSRWAKMNAPGACCGVQFLLDTDATDVAIPPALAERLNLRRGPEVEIRTASDIIPGYLVTLDKVSLGPLALTRVRLSASERYEAHGGNDSPLGAIVTVHGRDDRFRHDTQSYVLLPREETHVSSKRSCRSSREVSPGRTDIDGREPC